MPDEPVPTTRRQRSRLVPAFGLFLLAPLVGEYLLGNMAITDLPLLLILAPFYGGGALLIREVTRRLELGWPSMILLALAYAIVEEGVVLQTLFNRDVLGLGLLDYGYIEPLGMSAWWTVYVLTIHTVWSISVPIALVEALTKRGRHDPWLRWPSMAVVVTLFLAACTLNYVFIQADYPYQPSLIQWAGALASIVGLTWAAVRLGRRPVQPGRSTDHPPGLHAVSGTFLGFGSVFMGLLLLSVLVGGAIPGLAISGMAGGGMPAWLNVTGLITIIAIAAVTLVTWSRRPGWGEPHRVSVAGGLLLTYAWYGIAQQTLADNPQATHIAGNAVFAVAAVGLLFTALRRAQISGTA